ncbi:SCAN domain-containing protein 3 [Trichinella spiralis]|uniref:SCAN domain-containing protein 3 n=1 Tax=Trichinella spiralis TaxID=6334 RepID=A0A0V1AQD0_TRISP|nr:SCAN domain-containing protein 3 [Trichinella spiralis]
MYNWEIVDSCSFQLKLGVDLLDFEIILPNKTESEENYFSSQVHSIMGRNVIFLKHCICSAKITLLERAARREWWLSGSLVAMMLTKLLGFRPPRPLQAEYPKISSQSLRILVPFSSTYLCETGFSALMTLNTQHRNRLNVESDLRCTLSPTPPRIDNLVANKHCQYSH